MIPGTVEVKGNTVRECLEDLIKQYPELQGWLYGQREMLQVLIGINNEEIMPLKSAYRSVRYLNPKDEIRILAILSGG